MGKDKKRPPHETREEKLRERDRIEAQRQRDKEARKRIRDAGKKPKK